MQVICPQCATRLQLSAPKLPDHPFTIKCPKCQQGLTVSPPAADTLQLGTDESVPPLVPPSVPKPNSNTEHPQAESLAIAPPPVRPPTSSDFSFHSLVPAPQAEPQGSEEEPITPLSQPTMPQPPSNSTPSENNVAMGSANSPPSPTVTDDSQTLITGQNINHDLLQALTTLLTMGATAKAPARSEQVRRRNVVVCLANAEDVRQVKEVLKDTYEVTVAASPEQVTSMLQTSHELDILLLDPNFHAGQQGGATIMRHLNMLNPARRRRVFVVVTSHTYRTMDMYAAFAHGVNMIINSSDLEFLPEALSKSIEDFNGLYRAFNQVSGITPF